MKVLTIDEVEIVSGGDITCPPGTTVTINVTGDRKTGATDQAAETCDSI